MFRDTGGCGSSFPLLLSPAACSCWCCPQGWGSIRGYLSLLGLRVWGRTRWPPFRRLEVSIVGTTGGLADPLLWLK